MNDQTLARVGSERLVALADDMRCLGTMWLKPATGSDHASRLEGFYAPQAAQYDKFRSRFLWGRRPMLSAAAARLNQEKKGSLGVWVDLGGGTAENVASMADFIDLSRFEKIYVVDLCPSLCKIAREKVQKKGWSNVEVVEADACAFVPAGDKSARLVTFSYSLSMIPSFHRAIDQASSYLEEKGMVGVADFYTSAKYDLPCRQMPYLSRVFWRSVFDMDNINLDPSLRQYLDHSFSRIHEFNSSGSIPYVPRFLEAPYYVWLGVKDSSAGRGSVDVEKRNKRPPAFPPTFIYSLSWEDPRTDEPILKVGKGDVVLTLTSGGCNTLDLAAQGADLVVSVDMNPAQSALLELKVLAIRHLAYEDLWLMFGKGVHPDIERVFERDLAPWMSEGALKFWNRKMYYFQSGFYYHGAMGVVIRCAHWVQVLCGMRGHFRKFVDAPSQEAQIAVWESFWAYRFITALPERLLALFQLCLTWLLLNRLVCWMGLGVPPRQYALIASDGRDICEYAATTFDGAARKTRLATENYFYRACIWGSFSKECCPAYLKPDIYKTLKGGAVDRVKIATNTFLGELYARRFTRVILMDHVDWLDDTAVAELARGLQKQVVPGGRIIWRSASLNPPYGNVFQKHGFKIECVHRVTDKDQEGCIDRVNMYASFWLGIREASRR